MSLGLYVSRCGGRVSSVIDIDQAISDVSQIAAVARVVDELHDPDVIDRIVGDVKDAGLDAVVLAGHSVEYYAKSLSGQQIKNRLMDAGVNPNKVVAANIFEQGAKAHGDDPEGATLKAKALIDVAAQRAVLADPQEGTATQPIRSVLILGATEEALIAAQRLLQLGYSVVVADRANGRERLRGRESLRATASYVLGHPDAQVVDGASLVDGQGWLGDYEVVLETDAGRSTYRVGGIIIADPTDPDWITEMRPHFKVDVNDDGCARTIDPVTHPAETVEPGVMVISIDEDGARLRDSVTAADSAAMALILKLSRPENTHYRDTSDVDETLCGGCASCVRTCAFGACYMGDDGLSHVDIRRCRGCGKCVVSCPVGARDIVNSPHHNLIAAIGSLAAADTQGPKVLGFLCGGCGYPAGDDAGAKIVEGADTYPASFLPIRIPCGGRLDTLYVLEAFKAGFDAVTVFRCREGHCHNLIGNLDMDRRINLLRIVLRSRRIDDSRLRIIDISPFEGERFIEQVNEVYDTIGTLDEQKEVAR
jgi:coenzyme F420-reducing hydrogenase delta subunit/Pyruvate/2-oxoacid:ferredoxin oxidoreductase delta subunit